MITYNKADKTLDNIARIAEDRIKGKYDITILIDDSLSEFEGKIEDGVISAGSYSELLNTLGRFVRNPKIENGTFKSKKEICAMYFASHNHNYYECAPLEEIYRHIDDIALWGTNLIRVWFDMYYFDSMEDGKEYAERLKKILRYAKSIGLKIMMTTISNEAFRTSPEQLRADWTPGHDGYVNVLQGHYHVEICPNAPGGLEKILEYRRSWFETFKDLQLDYLSITPYDEGGCSCSKCAPWGGNGYIKTVEAIIPMVKEYMPNTDLVLSLWQFGTFTETDVEFEMMNKVMDEGRLSECKYLVAEPQYQRYAFEKGMRRPILGFPEISMCDIVPWGGYGSNPIPSLLQELWDRDGDKLAGGWPYSEGFYEEINKVVMLRLYRDGQSASDTIKEYLSYEFGLEGELLQKAHDAIFAMEKTLHRGFEPGHRYPIDNPEGIPEIEKAIVEVDASLPEEIRNLKKWQMIYLRAVIDGELYRNDFRRNAKVLEYFNKIIELCYLHNGRFVVKPDIIDDDKYGRILTRKELSIIAAGGEID